MISKDTLLYFYSTVPQVFATLLGLFVIFIVIVQTQLKKRFLIEAKKMFMQLEKRGATYYKVKDDEQILTKHTHLFDELKILIEVEDDESIEKVLKKIDEANIFKDEKSEFDLLFSDVVLPFRNGFELAIEFRKINPNIHILLTSGYAEQKVKVASIQKEGFHFLQKPYTIAQILNTI